MKKHLLLALLIVIAIPFLQAQNLVVNGDFEAWTDGAADGWTLVDPGITVTQATDPITGGSSSASVEVTTGTQGDTDLRQNIEVVAGTTYDLSVQVYNTEGTMQVRWYYGGTYGNYSDNTVIGSWQTFSTSFTAATSGSIEVGVRFYDQAGFDGSEIIYLDDMTMTVPADTDPPVWATGYPKATNINETSFDVTAKLDESGTVYYVVMDYGSAAPSPAEVMAGTGAAGATAVAYGNFLSGTTETSDPVTGLTTDHQYSVFLVAADDEDTPNVQGGATEFYATPIIPPSTLYLAEFTDALDPFVQFSEAGDSKTWVASSGYAEMNGYGSTEAEIDWLISPEVDLTNVTSPSVAFSAAWRFGTNDETHFLKFVYSVDYDGNTANIGTSTWMDVGFTLPEQDTWTELGPFNVSELEGQTVYFAFVYNNPDNYSRWRIDDAKVMGYAPETSDATLSDLTVAGETIENFDPAKTSYVVELPAGTVDVPIVGYTTNSPLASTSMVSATDLSGDNAARTTTILVTAQDGTTQISYTVLFNPVIEVNEIAALRTATDLSRKYTLKTEAILIHQDSYRNKKYIMDATGAIEIDDQPGVITSTYNIGDGITGITGTLEDYYGMMQFHPEADPGAATHTGLPVLAKTITVSEFKTNFENYEAQLVKITGVVFNDAGVSFANGKNYKVSVGEDTTVFRTHYYDKVSGTIPVKADITGIAVWDWSEAKIAPRMAGDLVAYSSDAGLSDLTVSDVTVTDFATGTTTYAVVLDEGTTAVPAVGYTLSDAKASAVVTDATDLAGDEAARTTTVVVTAEDGITTTTYSIVFTVYAPSDDASLSDLTVSDVTVTGFASGTTDYAVLLDIGTTQVPTVGYTLSDENASAVVNDATDLFGDEAARTTTVVVTAEDNTTTMTYSIVFTVDNTGINDKLSGMLTVYPVPTGDVLKVSGLKDGAQLEIINMVGTVLSTISTASNELDIDVSKLKSGVYILKSGENSIRFIKK